jgi:hypothetical protein
VILKHKHEHMIELRDAVSVMLALMLLLGLRGRHSYRERQSDC